MDHDPEAGDWACVRSITVNLPAPWIHRFLIAVISAAAAVVVKAISYYFTKMKEREADWRKYNFELYKEFVVSLSGI